MECKFHVGQKVVCIVNNWAGPIVEKGCWSELSGAPSSGEIVTIERIVLADDGDVCLVLKEYGGSCFRRGPALLSWFFGRPRPVGELCFPARGFRPLKSASKGMETLRGLQNTRPGDPLVDDPAPSSAPEKVDG